MKPFVIIVLLLLTALSFRIGQSGFEALAEQKGADISSEGDLVNYLSLEDRLSILARLRKGVDDNYAAIAIKRERLGLDIDAVFLKAETTERQIEKKRSKLKKDSPALRNERANLQFFDRLRQLIAVFQDTHFSLSQSSVFPKVHVGLESKLVDGRILISGVDSTRLKSEGIEILPELGDEIVSINGQPAKTVAEDLGTYIPASSLSYRDALASGSILRRNFAYPTDQTLRLRLKSRAHRKLYDLKLAWAVEAQPQNEAVINLSQDLELLVRDDSFHSPLKGIDPPRELEKAVTWYDADRQDNIAYRTGFVRDYRAAYGVLQVYSFFEKQVSDRDKVSSVSWRDPVIKFIKKLKKEKIPLILDLRFHKGGDISHARDLMRMITRQGESYASFTEAFRVTKSLEKLTSLKESEVERYSEQVVVRYLKQAVQQKKPHTIVWSFAPVLGNEPEIGGYNEPIIALISPFCISACEYLASMIKSSQRGMLLGTSTNGSGTAFFTMAPFITRTDIELNANIFVNIPNKIIGQPGPPGQNLFLADDAVFNLSLENQPISPDKPFFDGPIDLKTPDRSWFEAAKSLLRKQQNYLSH